MSEQDYTKIDQPYNTYLERSEDTSNNGNTETMPVKSDGSMSDVWINNFIRSQNWKPKKVGFYIDGQTGYAEFTNVFVSGDIQALTGTIGGFTIGATDLKATSGGNTTIISSGPIAFSAGVTGAPNVTITQAGVLTMLGGTITGSTIQTDTSGARIVIDNGNDISLFDTSVGGGGTVTGNTAAIKFIKDSDNNRFFTMQKRAGKDSNTDNVFELFSSSPPTNRHNFIFIGNDGTFSNGNVGVISLYANIKTSEVESAVNGKIQIGLTSDGGSASGNLIITDSRASFDDSSFSGNTALLTGSGDDAAAGIGYRIDDTTVDIGIYHGTRNAVTKAYTGNTLFLGHTLVPDVSSAYNLGTSTSRLATIYSGQINAAGHILPSATSTYNIGSTTYRWNDITCGGTIATSGSMGCGGSFVASGTILALSGISLGGVTRTTWPSSGVTSITASGGLTSTGGSDPTISIATSGVTNAKIASSAVTGAKIANGSVTSSKTVGESVFIIPLVYGGGSIQLTFTNGLLTNVY